MIMDSLKTADYSVDEETITFRIDNLFDYKYQVEVPKLL